MERKGFFVSTVLAFAAWGGLSVPTLLGLHGRWRDLGDSYVLGYPLIAVALGLLYSRRGRLRTTPVAPVWLGVVLFATTALAIYVARLIQLQIVQQVLLPVSLWLLVLALFGWRMGAAVLLPILLQYFGMPVWDFLIGILQGVTVYVVETLFGWLHIPAYIDGNHINLPYGTVTVADSCSGLNLLLATLLIAILQVQMGRYTVVRRIQFLLLAIFIGLLDNWIRVVVLILIAYFSKMQSPIVYDHASFGWWIYAATLVPLLWIAMRLESPASGSASTSASSIPMSPSRFSVFPGLAVVGIVAAGEFGMHAIAAREGLVRGWRIDTGTGLAAALSERRAVFMPEYAGYDLEQAWQLPQRSQLLVLTYVRQSRDKKLIYFSNVIAEEKRLVNLGRMPIGGGAVANVAIVKGAESRVVWWYYWVDGRVSASPIRTKLNQIGASLFGDPSAALIVLSQACGMADCEREFRAAASPESQPLFEVMRRLQPLR